MLIKFPLKTAIVDDDSSTLSFLKSALLSFNGFEVHTFISPIKALETIKKEDFQILITDISMPDMTGSELIREVNLLKKGIVSIAITNRNTMIDSHSCFRAGAWNYLQKPISRMQILSLAQRVFIHFESWNEVFMKISASKPKNEDFKKELSSECIIDFNKVLYTLAGDRKLLNMTCQQFIGSYSMSIGELKKAIEVNDYEKIERMAHQIKGSASNFYAQSVVDISHELELKGSEKQMEHIEVLVELLDEQLKLMFQQLKNFLESA